MCFLCQSPPHCLRPRRSVTQRPAQRTTDAHVQTSSKIGSKNRKKKKKGPCEGNSAGHVHVRAPQPALLSVTCRIIQAGIALIVLTHMLTKAQALI